MRFNKELEAIQNEFERIPFDPTANRKEAQAIIELYQKEIENRYRGEVHRELEISIRSIYEKLTN